MLFFSYALSCFWYYYVGVVVEYNNPEDDFIIHFSLENDSNILKVIKT